MKKILNLNQAKSIEFGFKNIQCAAIFIVIADLIEKNKDGIELVDIAKQLPLLNLETDTFKRYIDDLKKKNVITMQKNTGKKYAIKLTELGEKYFEVKEKNTENEICSLVGNFIGEIAKKFFLLSEVRKNDSVKYNEELNNLIDSLVENGIYELYFAKLHSFIDKKYYSYKFRNVEIDPHLIFFKDSIVEYTKNPMAFKVVSSVIDPLKVLQDDLFHTMEIMRMFYLEEYLNRES